MNLSRLNRILIIGIQGSGKSTFASKLGKLLNREVIHLDKLYWKSGWVKPSKEEWGNTIKELINKKEWIMDGNYISTMDIRLQEADIIIFFDFPRWLCILNSFRRLFNKNVFDKAEGVQEKVSFDLLKKILLFPREEIIVKLNRTKGRKIITVKNYQEVNKLLNTFANQKT